MKIKFLKNAQKQLLANSNATSQLPEKNIIIILLGCSSHLPKRSQLTLKIKQHTRCFRLLWLSVLACATKLPRANSSA